MTRALLVLLLLAPSLFAQEEARPAEVGSWWLPARRRAHAELEERLVGAVDARTLRDYHDLLASDPHRAGTPGDLKVAANLAKVFRDLGLEVEEQELWLYLAQPVAAQVEVVAPERVALSIREEAVDAYSGRGDLSFGFNAYSGSGEAEGGVVYANYGTKEDFEKLAELGVEVKGRIVVARYGGNFRGYKAKFAEAAGAAGLVIYTDPKDSGYARGIMYPEGGYANGSYIQRGSVLTLPYRGDPLTPGTPATREAERLDPAKVAFPRIPVQPVGWEAAHEILKRMTGAAVPAGWQGGLPLAYRLTGGDALRVRVMVKQERKLMRTFNVTGTLRGASFPDQFVVVGAHHDAWGFGAGDPTAGTIVVLEAARCFAEAARAGRRPLRSIVFAGWAAEEYGILGSTEWVEAHRERLTRHGIAYLNLDMAAMGPNLRSSAAPSLKRVIDEAVQAETEKPLERFGDLGGGSDHLGFYCHLAIPAAGLSAGGSQGVSYHSLFDNLAWYRQVVGDDYEPARRLSRVVNRVLARLANGDLLPLDPVQYAADVRRHLKALEARATALAFAADFSQVAAMAGLYEIRARRIHGDLRAAVGEGKLDADSLARANAVLLRLERAWVHEPGLPGRPWFKSLYAASDESSGYAAWMLPGLRYAVEHKDREVLARMEEAYLGVLRRLEAELTQAAPSASPPR